ncbi:MAG: SRPBCC domain-containing protein [Gaiellales bacterium]
MSGTHTCTVVRVIAANVEEVWDAWTNVTVLADWITCGGRVVKADVRVGGEFELHIGPGSAPERVHTGRYLVVERPHRLELTWRSHWTDGESHLEVSLRKLGALTEITVVHSGLPSLAIEADHAEGWRDYIALVEEAVVARRALTTT